MSVEPDVERTRATRTLPYQPGLDGLRALAVMSVLLYHADLPWIPGGFLGVDVFFVVSGYLITALLVAETRRTGKVDFRHFWMRRARRLLPALFAMLTVVAIYVLLFLPAEASKFRGDLVAALVYGENWWLIFRNQSYFAAAGRPPLLQHLWSLAVEEQFYLLWPLIFFGLMAVLRGRKGRILLVVCTGAIASTVLMGLLYHPLSDPSRVYYGTDTRAAPLLVGAALALVWSPWQLHARIRRSARVLLDVVGIAAMAALVWIVLNVTEFEPNLYRFGFLGVALLCALVIAVVVHPATGWLTRFLSNPVMHWIGVRSYGIYLWHWPVYMITRPHLDVGLTGLPLLALRIGLTFVLAELSYRYIETPVRNGALSSFRARLRESRGRERARLTSMTLASWVAATFVITVMVAWFSAAGPAPLPPGFSSASVERSSVVSHARRTAPPVAAGADAPQPSVTTTIPAAVATLPPATIPPAPPPTRVYAVGDSVMLGAQPALEAALPGIVVDAAVSRQADAVVQEMRNARDTGQLGDVVVVHTGTNGLVTSEEFDEMMSLLQGVRKVVIVNLKEPRRWEGQDNDVLAAGVQRYPNTVLVNWHDEGNAHPEVFWDDGIHLRPDGAPFYAGLIAAAVNS